MLRAICGWIVEWGFPPTRREIIDVLDSADVSVARCVRDLAGIGFLVERPHTARTIVVTEAGWRAAGFDGPPLLAAPDI